MAWIEIWSWSNPCRGNRVATYVVAWIEIHQLRQGQVYHASRHLCSGVDWNVLYFCFKIVVYGRHLCSGVDWNIFLSISTRLTRRRHLCSGVDWNLLLLSRWAFRISRHLCSGVDWNLRNGKLGIWKLSRHLCSGVDWNKLMSSSISWRSVATYVVAWIEIGISYYIDGGALSPLM